MMLFIMQEFYLERQKLKVEIEHVDKCSFTVLVESLMLNVESLSAKLSNF